MSSKKAACIRKVSNFTDIKPYNIIDKKVFDADITKLYIDNGASPKLKTLLEKINELDQKDMEKSGKLFKHIIFTDLNKSQYGAKLIAGALVAHGLKMCFYPRGSGFALHDDDKLLESRSDNFAVLLSKSFYKRPMNSKIRKSILDKFNSRPDNIEGDLVRFIVLDQGFKEGIDVYDVKYVHLFEPLTVNADEKQAIGRGTRFCGQKGLEFHQRYGWPLYVYKYDVAVPTEKQEKYTSKLFDLYLKNSDIDIRKNIFAAELENATIDAAVDKNLTKAIHGFTVEKIQEGGTKRTAVPPKRIMNKKEMESYIQHFKRFTYPHVKLENKCMSGGRANVVSFTPSQDFVRHYFQSSSAYKGLLLHHSVGTGKTCSAIATATTGFEDYTILWVTRHTLKNDIWKNMVNQVCHVGIQEQIEDGLSPSKISMKNKSKFISKNWMNPISYKQFSNMLLQKNKIYDEMVKRNGSEDPLKKTLLIIDEAHKLYSPGVAASEKPNTEILEQMIQSSYDISGKDSVRLLMMTATPYTEDGIEMIKLLNLLRDGDKLPDDFEVFAQTYLNEDGKFTKKGRKIFQDQIAGYISYLNRSQDARNFAYPILENVYSEMSFEKEPMQVQNKYDLKNKELKEELNELKNFVRTNKKNQNKNYLENKKECEQNAKTEYTTKEKQAFDKKSNELLKCKDVSSKEKKRCKDEATASFKQTKDFLLKEKKTKLEECKNVIKENDDEIIAAVEEMNQKNAEIEANKQEKAEKSSNNKQNRKFIVEKRMKIKEKKNIIKDILVEINKKVTKIYSDYSSPADRRKAILALKQGPLYDDLNKHKNDIELLRQAISNTTVEIKMTSFRDNPEKLKKISQEYALNNICKIGNKPSISSSTKSSMVSTDISDSSNSSDRTSATSNRTSATSNRTSATSTKSNNSQKTR
jgi:hypothetical protein